MTEILPKLTIRGKVAGNNQESHVMYFLHHKGTIASAEQWQKREDYTGFCLPRLSNYPLSLKREDVNSRAKAAPCFSIKPKTDGDRGKLLVLFIFIWVF